MTSTAARSLPATLEFRGFGWRPLGRVRPAVRDLDLTIAPGERVLLAGPSGAGKSTLLRAAAGVLQAGDGGELTGTVRVGGGDAAGREVPVGLLLQRPADGLVADGVGRDVAFGPENLGLSRTEIWHRVAEALELVGFPYGANTPTGSLSDGESQRLALAGALALRPGLLLLDEPTSLLDADAAALVRAAVLRVVEATGATLVVVEHRLEPWLEFVDRMLVLAADGTLECDGPPSTVLRQHANRLADAGIWVPGLGPPTPEQLAPIEPVPPCHTGTLAREPLVSAQRLTVRLRSRGLRERRAHVALRGVEGMVPSAAVTAFTGASGAGKSTLLRALGGLVEPTSGRVWAAPALAGALDPQPHRWGSADLASRVGWVPQDPEHGFLANRVVAEVRLTAERLGRVVDAEQLLHLFRLNHLRDANPYRLSGGEQRRLSLLAGLAHRPLLALLDEPTVGQDRHTWAVLVGLLRALAAGGCGVAVATHDRDLVDAVVDHEQVLDRGTLVSSP